MKDHYFINGGRDKVDAICINGWKKDRENGFRTFVSVPAKSPGTKSDRWKKMVTTVTRSDGSKFLTNTLWDTQRKRLKFTDMGYVANPNAPDGGYWGKGGTKLKIRTQR